MSRLRWLAALVLEAVWALEWALCDRPPRSYRLLKVIGGR